MKVKELEIPRYGWRMRVFIAVSRYNINRIMDALEDIDCPEHILYRVYKNLRAQKMDTGFTYSNRKKRETVMVIGLTSSPAEFLNSLQHELRHFVDDVAMTVNVDLSGEKVAYLTGDINLYLWEDIHEFLCCCNKNKGYERD